MRYINIEELKKLEDVFYVQNTISKKYTPLINYLISNFSNIEEYIKERPIDKLTKASFWEWRYEELDDEVIIYLYSQGISSASNDVTAIFNYKDEDNWNLIDIYGGIL